MAAKLPLAPGEAQALCIQLLAIVAYLHSVGIAHGQLDSSRMFVLEVVMGSPQLLLRDFGVLTEFTAYDWDEDCTIVAEAVSVENDEARTRLNQSVWMESVLPHDCTPENVLAEGIRDRPEKAREGAAVPFPTALDSWACGSIIAEIHSGWSPQKCYPECLLERLAAVLVFSNSSPAEAYAAFPAGLQNIGIPGGSPEPFFAHLTALGLARFGSFDSIMAKADPSATNLVRALCRLRPADRLPLAKALQHPYIADGMRLLVENEPVQRAVAHSLAGISAAGSIGTESGRLEAGWMHAAGQSAAFMRRVKQACASPRNFSEWIAEANADLAADR